MTVCVIKKCVIKGDHCNIYIFSNLPLELFGNNEAIQCTEIYEYALALGNAAVCLYNFQVDNL